MKFKIIILSVLICFLLNCDPHKIEKEEEHPRESLSDQLSGILDYYTILGKIKGLSAAVIFSNGERWLGTSGFSHENIKINSQMLFPIASITKTFLSTLSLKLLEDNKLNLKDKLITWIPEVRQYFKEIFLLDPEINLEHLLSHRSGLGDFFPDVAPHIYQNLNRIWVPGEILKFTNSNWYANIYYKYSNANYHLMGMILNKVTHNQPLSQLLEEKIFSPLLMENTYLAVEQDLPAGLKWAHGWMDIDEIGLNGDGTEKMDDLSQIPIDSMYSAAWAAGAIVSTPEEVAVFIHNLFNEKILTKNSMFVRPIRILVGVVI